MNKLLTRVALASALLLAPSTSTSAQELSASLGGSRSGLSWSAHLSTGHRPRLGVSYGNRAGRRPSYAGSHATKRIWVPARHERVARRTWVPGNRQREWIAPLYDTRYDPCGRSYQVIVREGYWHDVYLPGHYKTHYESVRKPVYYRTVRY